MSKEEANQLLQQPLTEAEMNQLNDVLFAMNDDQQDATSMSMVDGLFTALAISPETVSPNEWLTWIVGEGDFPDQQTAQTITTLLMRHHNTVQRQLRDDAMSDFSPIFLYRENSEVPWVADWCHGFMAAVHLRSEAWLSAFHSEEERAPLDVIYGMTLLAPPDLEQAPEANEQAHDEVEEVAFYMRRLAYTALDDYRHQFDPIAGWEVLVDMCVMQLRDHLLHPVQDETCPCGSGKDFIECCGKENRTVH